MKEIGLEMGKSPLATSTSEWEWDRGPQRERLAVGKIHSFTQQIFIE
jgi:hypothetical protein